MRKRTFCAAALLCGASLAHAQGFGGTTATGASAAGYFGNQGYHVNQVGYSPEYAAYVQQAQAQAAMAGYAGTGYPGATAGYPGATAGYGYGGYVYPAQALAAPNALPPSPSVPMTGMPMPGAGMPTGAPMMEGDPVVDASAASGVARPNWAWLNADYTLTWLQPMKLPYPLVTVGAGTEARPGALGQPGTSVVLGNTIDTNSVDGLKLEAGFFLEGSKTFSLEWVGHIYAASAYDYNLSSDNTGLPVIGRPIFGVTEGEQRAFVDSLPGALAGGINVNAETSLFRTEFNVGCNSYGETWSGAAIIGIRYMRLSDSLTISDRIRPLLDGALDFTGQDVLVGESVTDTDQFKTRNTFYGGQVGGRFRWDGTWVIVSGYGKVGLGVTEQTVEINGSTTLTRRDGVTQLVAPGGVLALPSNIGSRTRTVFSYSPEAGLNLGLRLTRHVAVSAGYSFTYWSNVARAAQQIDPNVNGSQSPTDQNFGASTGPTRPILIFNDEDVHLHTLSLGLALQY